MGTQNAKRQIVRENFARLKYICLIFVGYSAFTLVTDFAPIEVWNPDVIGIYPDIGFAVFSVATAIFCWTYKGGSDSVKHLAAAAVEACRGNPDLDVVLMDIKMPVMSGYEATRLIREFNPRVAIIAQTAFALAGDREKAIACGADAYLTKPLSKAKLFGCIAKCLSKRGSAPLHHSVSGFARSSGSRPTNAAVRFRTR